MVAELAIMGHMTVAHQKIVAANAGDAIFLLAGAIDGYAFAKGVGVADFNAGVRPLVAVVLRLRADDDIGKQHVVATQGHVAHERDVVMQPRAASDARSGADRAERADDDFLVDLRPRVDPGVGCDAGGHVEFSYRPPGLLGTSSQRGSRKSFDQLPRQFRV
jgi:hypothetical protein